MDLSLLCWSCGESLERLTPPIGHRDQCPACANYLHVCKMCEFYDPSVTGACREDDADDVTEKGRLNFCAYFAPSANAFDPSRRDSGKQAASAFNALFSETDETSASGDGGLSEAGALFSNDGPDEPQPDEPQKD